MASSYRGTSLSASTYFTDYASTIGTAIERPTLKTRMQDFKEFLSSTNDQGQFLIFGKNALDLFLHILYILVMWVILALVLVGFMAVFYVVIDWNYPTLQGPDSILQTPGLSFRPQPDSMSTVIRFVKGDATTYANYLDHTEAYLRYYENENQQGENYIDCSSIRERRKENFNKVCRFDVTSLGSDCVKQQNFGFDDGQPCILLKLNKIFNWIPEEYTNETIPSAIGGSWSQWSITVNCEGENAADKENIGQLFYFPAEGFHFKYFPYLNQQGYRSPLVFVRFDEPRPGTLIMVTCKAYAKNIVHNTIALAGQVHFELLVD
ncbi:sodium/potassium-transporting ATPase subunit beta [Patella vulgata]|uniref:sodium/potassium-transporting ATPase subunit beta n=1 Tax=Patella vulgata TaxID=6465 RepID=UPI0024A7EA1F|nr:sodium/potassium-transporting ATPase subunit beta [Patella vulgata]